ncbi:MAG: biosynthetic-type acetolactate synthase large subunit [Burkholderiaceae bacterium]|jgi:acetolactate synthase-1/2/3 large subunit|nr:biosynthetic-type acetolactate synthase large subunit [Burkholderiaceae bacterium]
MSVEINGSEILVRCLAEEGVEHVFGYPGGAVLYVYDAIYHQNRFRHILVRHEQAAIHAADAYARSSGRTGVAIVTSGPGVTNTVTGLATAHMDSIPLVVISGQVATHFIGQDAFQECDAVGITRPCVKHNFLISDVRELAATVRKAFYIARSGRPGPVLIDLPKDISMQVCRFSYPERVEMRSYRPIEKGHAGQIRKALQVMLQAKRPVIYAGGGVILSDSAPELNQLVDKLGYPCTTTLQGLGGYRASSKQYLGMLGMHGTYEANCAVQNSDVLIAIGARFDDRVIGNPEPFAKQDRRIIHIDVDPSSISKRVKVDIPIVGNAKDVLQEMLSQLGTPYTPNNPGALSAWWNEIEGWRKKSCLAYEKTDQVVKPQFVIEKLWEITEGDAFIASDVGQHQMWAAQYYGFDKPRRWFSSGGLGTMGVGLPYAMGVQMANPGAIVACVTGEASFQMNIQELATCKQYNLTPKIILLNNGVLGMVRQWQRIDYASRYSESYVAALPDFTRLAESYGHVGMKVEKAADVEAALREAFAIKDKLVLVNILIDSTENVWPMVRPGRGLTEMLMRLEDL